MRGLLSTRLILTVLWIQGNVLERNTSNLDFFTLVYLIWSRTIVSNSSRIRDSIPTTLECSWTWYQVSIQCSYSSRDEFWSRGSCWFTVDQWLNVKAWESEHSSEQLEQLEIRWVHRGREGKEKAGGMGLRNWTGYSKSSKHLLPKFSAMDHCWSCILLWLTTKIRWFNCELWLRNHSENMFFAYCTVLIKN